MLVGLVWIVALPVFGEQCTPEPLDLSAWWPANGNSNDIIGGNSGSPVIDRNARIVGLIFDGNLQFLGASFVYESSGGRAVAVDSAALTAALKTVYHADRIVKELGIP